MQCVPAGAEEHGVAREARVAARVERGIGTDCPQPIVELAEVDSALRRRDTGADHPSEASFGAARPGDALVVDLEVRVLALRDAERRHDVAERPGLERAIALNRGAPRAAPGERDRQTLAHAQHPDRADAAAIGKPIAIVVVENREKHQLALEAGPAKCRRALADGFRREARAFVDEQNQCDVSGTVERAIAFAYLDAVEVAAGLQPSLDRGDAVGRQRLTERDAGQLDDLFVAQVGIAVDADLSDDFLLRIRVGHERARGLRSGIVECGRLDRWRGCWLWNPDARFDVRFLVVGEASGVRGLERAHGHRDASVDVHLPRQPHARERLPHGHRRADIVDLDEPGAGQEVHPDVVEGVLDDLMLGRIDP